MKKHTLLALCALTCTALTGCFQTTVPLGKYGSLVIGYFPPSLDQASLEAPDHKSTK